MSDFAASGDLSNDDDQVQEQDQDKNRAHGQHQDEASFIHAVTAEELLGHGHASAPVLAVVNGRPVLADVQDRLVGTLTAVGRIAEGTTFLGDIVVRDGGGELVVEGRLLGDIYHEGKVTVAENGFVIGSIVADSLLVKGRVSSPKKECITNQFAVDGKGSVRVLRVVMAEGRMAWSSTGAMNARIEMLPAAEAAAMVANNIETKASEVQEEFARMARESEE